MGMSCTEISKDDSVLACRMRKSADSSEWGITVDISFRCASTFGSLAALWVSAPVNSDFTFNVSVFWSVDQFSVCVSSSESIASSMATSDVFACTVEDGSLSKFTEQLKLCGMLVAE